MAIEKDTMTDTEAARGEAAEESAAVQPTHYHSRLEAEEPSHAGAPPAPLNGEEDARPPSRVRAQPPEEFTGGEFEGASDVSGGLGAVWFAMKHIVREAGLVRGTRTLLKVNQKDGFDCPGCAWPDPDGERSHAEFCENGAKAVAEEATTRRVTPDFFREWSVADLSRKSDYWLGKQGRLTHPMVLRAGATHYEPISVGRGFQANRGRAERARVARRGGLLHFGSHAQRGGVSLPALRATVRHEQPARLLEHVPRVLGRARSTETIGVGKGTVTLDDFEQADCIFVIGQNPGTNHPRMLSTLQRGKAARLPYRPRQPAPRGGARALQASAGHPGDLIGGGTELADLFLQVRINGDVALLKGLMKEVLSEEKSAARRSPRPEVHRREDARLRRVRARA